MDGMRNKNNNHFKYMKVKTTIMKTTWMRNKKNYHHEYTKVRKTIMKTTWKG